MQGTQQTSFAMYSRATYEGSAGARSKNGSNSTASPAARITSPMTSTIIVLDPDIPPNWQRVSFSAEGSNLCCLMDGKAFAKSASAQWPPWPGRHVVQIAGKRGEVLDEVRVEVRGWG